MEFTAANIFQHSPFGDILKSLKSLSVSGEPWPNYGQQGWDTDGEENQNPPTTHLVATVDNLNDVLNFDSEDIDGMDDDAGDVRAIRPIPKESRHWLSKPIIFDHLDYSRSIRNAGWTALVLDPIIDGLQFRNVLMDGGSGLNLIYQDTIRPMGIDPTRICHSKTSFQGVTPGPDTHCMGFLRLEVIFGSTDNLRREKLTFHIVPFSSCYQALLGREAFARFNAIPHYASLTLKMPGPRGIISLKGKSLRPRTRIDESGTKISLIKA
ncbi:uncharacterized protein [Aegilops tauschii subsp. strangulata]|uniref:uncharacterized protein n=1 Tax=Aegilops tauschii subsp. strangulata TaxID=200361 RepID=UPI001ABC7CF2